MLNLTHSLTLTPSGQETERAYSTPQTHTGGKVTVRNGGLPVAKLELFNSSVASSDLHMPVEYDTPRVQLFTVVHHDRVGSVDGGEYHCTTESTACRQRHVTKRLQTATTEIRLVSNCDFWNWQNTAQDGLCDVWRQPSGLKLRSCDKTRSQTGLDLSLIFLVLVFQLCIQFITIPEMLHNNVS